MSLLRLLRHARRLRLEPESTANDVVVRRARHRARARPRRRVASVARRRRMAFGRPDSGWCLDGLHICYSMKCSVLLWMVYMGTNESTRDRALTDRARARDRCRTRARRDAHARAFTPARARVKTFPSVRRGGRAREREEWGRERGIFAAEGRARAREVEDSHRTARVRRTRGRERAGERRERCCVIARARVWRDELVAERVGAEGGEQVSTGAKDRKWEFRRHLPRCARGSRARGRGRARECGARCA